MAENIGYPPRRSEIEVNGSAVDDANPFPVKLSDNQECLLKDLIKEARKTNIYLSHIAGFEADRDSTT